MKNFRELHPRTKRGEISSIKRNELSEKELLAEARKLFQRIKKRKKVIQLVPYLPNRAIRVDLVGFPEVNFTISINKGKLAFSSKRTNVDLAIGIHKNLFLKLTRDKLLNAGTLTNVVDSVFLRKGPIREFRMLKPLLMQIIS